MTQPVRIDPDTLYPISWLEEQLEGTMNLPAFLNALELTRTGRDRIHQNALWGHEILRAMRHVAETETQPGTVIHTSQTQSLPPRKRSARTVTSPNLNPLTQRKTT